MWRNVILRCKIATEIERAEDGGEGGTQEAENRGKKERKKKIKKKKKNLLPKDQFNPNKLPFYTFVSFLLKTEP